MTAALDFRAIAVDEIITTLRAREQDADLLGEFHKPNGKPLTDAQMTAFRAAYDAALAEVVALLDPPASAPASPPEPELRKMDMVWADDIYGRSSDPCVVCGKGLKRGGQHWLVHVIDGGGRVLHPSSEHRYVEDAGELGFHKVGPECRKRFGDFAIKGAWV